MKEAAETNGVLTFDNWRSRGVSVSRTFMALTVGDKVVKG